MSIRWTSLKAVIAVSITEVSPLKRVQLQRNKMNGIQSGPVSRPALGRYPPYSGAHFEKVD